MTQSKPLPKWLIWVAYLSSALSAVGFAYFAMETYKHSNVAGLIAASGYSVVGLYVLFTLPHNIKAPTIHTVIQVQERIIRELAPESTVRFQVFEPSERGAKFFLAPPAQYVYLIQDISVTGSCKIGKTNHPSRRAREFGVLLPMKTRVIHIIRTEDMQALEKQLHRLYAAKRVNGEWFKLDTEDIEHIKSL
jgi:hypothetical protein